MSAGFNPSPDTRLTLNALRAEDSILVVTESAPEEREQAESDTLNQSLWLTMENQWTPAVSSVTVLSSSSFENDRDGIVLDPEQLVGWVMDDRDVDILELKQDWKWQAGPRHLLQFGFEARDQQAGYRYLSEAEYFGFYLAYPGVQESIQRDITAKVDGRSYALYFSDRISLTDQVRIETGLRWDRQTYQGLKDDDQFSPRLSMYYSPGSKTDLRLTWGRYYQSQGIHELQVEDGVDYFHPAQRADHLIAGFRYRFSKKLRLRVEAYQKDYDSLRPRFENLQDSLSLIPELEPDRARITPDSARARGLEMTFESDGTEKLDWWASYTLSRVTDSIDGREEKRNWDQRHALQAGIAWHSEPWEVGLAVNVHTGWPTTGMDLVESMETGDGQDEGDDEIDYALAYRPRNGERFATFASLDFRVSREWELSNSRISAFFEISNALNRKNECCIDFDLEDEDADPLVLEESVDFWLPILPAVGVLWEF
jgi:outer membrane receptor protein involved in Fe transport